MKRNKNQTEWLKEIEDDQNVLSLDNIGLTRWYGLRNWFMSKVLQQCFKIGYYDPETGRFVLGSPGDSYTWEMEFTTVSIGTLSVVCPEGYRMDIIDGGAQNATQATNIDVDVTISGQTIKDMDGYPGVPSSGLIK